MLAAGPELRITGAAAQTRMVSVARIRLVSRKSTRLFKGIICDDISEFESYMPSQPVLSQWATFRSQKFARHWDKEKLDRFIAKPDEVVPGNMKPYGGLTSAEDRAKVIAHHTRKYVGANTVGPWVA